MKFMIAIICCTALAIGQALQDDGAPAELSQAEASMYRVGFDIYPGLKCDTTASANCIDCNGNIRCTNNSAYKPCIDGDPMDECDFSNKNCGVQKVYALTGCMGQWTGTNACSVDEC